MNGLVEPSPRPPALPNAAKAARLAEEARKELDAARTLIAECGYHRRDEELAELDAVAGGRVASPSCRRAFEATRRPPPPPPPLRRSPACAAPRCTLAGSGLIHGACTQAIPRPAHS